MLIIVAFRFTVSAHASKAKYGSGWVKYGSWWVKFGLGCVKYGSGSVNYGSGWVKYWSGWVKYGSRLGKTWFRVGKIWRWFKKLVKWDICHCEFVILWSYDDDTVMSDMWYCNIGNIPRWPLVSIHPSATLCCFKAVDWLLCAGAGGLNAIRACGLVHHSGEER